jgi:hypothetical protein
MSHNEDSCWSLPDLVLHDIRGSASSWMTQHRIRCFYALGCEISGGLLWTLFGKFLGLLWLRSPIKVRHSLTMHHDGSTGDPSF